MSANQGSRDGTKRPSGEASRLPTRRPRWVTVLAMLMLLAGARLFLGSLTDLRRLATGRSMADVRMDGLADANQEVLIRGQLALEEAVDRAHPIAAGVQAAIRLVLALVFFFAVAAVFSGDPRARRASVFAAWAGMALHVGSGAFLLMVVRKGVAANSREGPRTNRGCAARSSRPGPTGFDPHDPGAPLDHRTGGSV